MITNKLVKLIKNKTTPQKSQVTLEYHWKYLPRLHDNVITIVL